MLSGVLLLFGVSLQSISQAERYAGSSSPPPWNAAFEDSNGNGEKDWGDMIGGRWVPCG